MEPERFILETGAERISSRTNPKTSAYAKLAEKKYRDESGLLLAEGLKLTREALRSDFRIREILLSETAVKQNPEAVSAASEAASDGIPVTVFSDPAFEKISTEKAPQGIIAVMRMPRIREEAEFSAWQEGRRLIMLDEIRDPGNLGTILRSAEALGMEGAVLSRSADPYQPKAVRAAMGTLFRLPLWLTDDPAGCAETLKRAGRRVLAAALGEQSLTLGMYEPLRTDCPVIGNEGHGLPEELLKAATACVRIPMAGGPESLNAAAAAACILWEYYRIFH